MITQKNIIRNIHIGSIIKEVIQEKKISSEELKIKIGYSSRDINNLFISKSIDSLELLKWSKALGYDFFRLYSSHLMHHHGISNSPTKKIDTIEIGGVQMQKNIYTKELIQFLVNKVRKCEMNSSQVINQYGIPKTTFYKWLQKYPKENKI
jgi:hypothetical protein